MRDRKTDEKKPRETNYETPMKAAKTEEN